MTVKKIVLLVNLMVWMVLTHADIAAHGVIGKFKGHGASVVEARYSDGKPMRYAEVTVYAPERKIPFQSAYTDTHGNFAFLPDKPGKWKVVFQDEMGHKTEVDVAITIPPSLTTGQHQDSQAPPGKESPHYTPPPGDQKRFPLYFKIVIGVCLIFGMGGFFSLFVSIRKSGSDNKE